LGFRREMLVGSMDACEIRRGINLRHL
jgi:hypothetical protein